MPIHRPIIPARAIELVVARDLEDAETLLADFAAAGLIKTYALMREVKPVGGPARTVRDSQIPPEDWDRIVAEDRIDVALNGGTVRLEGSQLKGGTPSVQITGVSFSEASLVKILDRYCAQSPLEVPKLSEEPVPRCSSAVSSPSSSRDRETGKKEVPPIKPGDLTASVAQAVQATGLSRTNIDKLMREGPLVRRKIGNRTLITVESIEKLVGAKVDRSRYEIIAGDSDATAAMSDRRTA